MTATSQYGEVEAASRLCLHLRGTNARLGPCLDSLFPGRGQSAVTMAERMSALLSELLSAGAALRAQPLPPRGHAVELDRELDRYRAQVERLRDLMPALQRHLLAERARLEKQRSRVASAAQWARASRQTL